MDYTVALRTSVPHYADTAALPSGVTIKSFNFSGNRLAMQGWQRGDRSGVYLKVDCQCNIGVASRFLAAQEVAYEVYTPSGIVSSIGFHPSICCGPRAGRAFHRAPRATAVVERERIIERRNYPAPVIRKRYRNRPYGYAYRYGRGWHTDRFAHHGGGWGRGHGRW